MTVREQTRAMTRSMFRNAYRPEASGSSAWTPASLGSNRLQDISSLTYSPTKINNLPIIPSTVGTLAQPRGQRCALFDGVNDYCLSPVTLNGATEFTIWRRAKYATTNAFDLDGVFGSTPIRLGRDNGSNQIWWDPGVNLGATAISVPNSVWHTLAITSKSGGTARLYKDGTQVATSSPGTFTIANGLSFWIGANNTNGITFNHGSNYCVSDYRIYNRELTASEITWLETDGASGTDPGLTNCLCRYTFSEESGTVAYDSSGKGNHGTYTNITQATFHATDAGVRYSLPNEKGYTLSGSVVIPANEASPTLDASGGALQYAGPIGLPATFDVPCLTGDGVSCYVNLGSPLIPASADFTVTFSAYITNTPETIFATNTSGATSGRLLVYTSAATTITAYGFGPDGAVCSVACLQNAWNTITLSRTGSTVTLTCNGVSATGTYATAINQVFNTTLFQNSNSQWFTGRISRLSILAGGVTKTFPLQDGPGSTNTNRDVAWYASNGTGGVVAGAIVNGTVANIWANRTNVVRDACIEVGGGIAANGAFVVGIPGSGNDAAGNAKTLAVGTHGNPYSRFVPNYWNAPALVQIGSDNTDKYAPTDTVQSESIADTRFRKAGFVKYFATRTALTGTDKTNAEAYAA